MRRRVQAVRGLTGAGGAGCGRSDGCSAGRGAGCSAGCGAGRWGLCTHSGVGVRARKPNTVEEQPLIQIIAKREAVSVGELPCPFTGFEAFGSVLQIDRLVWTMIRERR